MKVEINRKPIEFDEEIKTLSQLLKRENLDGQGRAVAIDNKLVIRSSWDNVELCDGMKITVIQAVCGG